MGFKAMTWVIDHSKVRGAPQRLMLLLIANRADDETGECFPGVVRLADECGYTGKNKRRSAQTVIRKLEDSGVISIEENAGIATNHGYTNRYTLSGYLQWLDDGKPAKKKPQKTPKTQSEKGGVQMPAGVCKCPPQGVCKCPPKPTVEPTDIKDSPTDGESDRKIESQQPEEEVVDEWANGRFDLAVNRVVEVFGLEKKFGYKYLNFFIGKLSRARSKKTDWTSNQFGDDDLEVFGFDEFMRFVEWVDLDDFRKQTRDPLKLRTLAKEFRDGNEDNVVANINREAEDDPMYLDRQKYGSVNLDLLLDQRLTINRRINDQDDDLIAYTPSAKASYYLLMCRKLDTDWTNLQESVTAILKYWEKTGGDRTEFQDQILEAWEARRESD